MTARDPELQRLIDESAIRRLLASYPRALDRQDHELLASLFHPGAIDDHGFFNGSGEGYTDWIRTHAVPGQHWMHHNGTQIIDINGAVAECETYCLAFCRQPVAGAERGAEIFLRVRYLDRVEQRDGVWRIAHRRVIYSPCHVLPISEEFRLTPECLLEAGFPADQTYHW